MILEEIIGGVVSTIIRENGEAVQLNIGDYFSDHERSTLTVVGNGKIVVRVDANCTVEIRGVENAVETVTVQETAPEVQETAPEVQEVAVEDTVVAATEATPAIVIPAKVSKAAE